MVSEDYIVCQEDRERVGGASYGGDSLKRLIHSKKEENAEALKVFLSSNLEIEKNSTTTWES
jgi:hypothetical protein